jgi:hypothetical protein
MANKTVPRREQREGARRISQNMQQYAEEHYFCFHLQLFLCIENTEGPAFN